MSDLWPKFQRDLTGLSTVGTHLVVEDSGHFIQTDRPDAVVEATRSLLARLDE